MYTIDIYTKINKQLKDKHFNSLTTLEKKNLFDVELKTYIISKIQKLMADKIVDYETLQSFSVNDLLELFASKIPIENRNDILMHFIRCILDLAGDLQCYGIDWWAQEENQELLVLPEIKINEDNLWDKLKTHKQTNYLLIFNTVYDFFFNKFLTNVNRLT